jgi:hypothetical protein
MGKGPSSSEIFVGVAWNVLLSYSSFPPRTRRVSNSTHNSQPNHRTETTQATLSTLITLTFAVYINVRDHLTLFFAAG